MEGLPQLPDDGTLPGGGEPGGATPEMDYLQEPTPITSIIFIF